MKTRFRPFYYDPGFRPDVPKNKWGVFCPNGKLLAKGPSPKACERLLSFFNNPQYSVTRPYTLRQLRAGE